MSRPRSKLHTFVVAFVSVAGVALLSVYFVHVSIGFLSQWEPINYSRLTTPHTDGRADGPLPATPRVRKPDVVTPMPQVVTLPRPNLGVVSIARKNSPMPRVLSAVALTPGTRKPTALAVGAPKPAGAALTLWGPETPAEVAAAFSAADTSLVDWLSAWQRRMARLDRDQSPYLDALDSSLRSSRIGLKGLIQLMRVVASFEGDSSQQQYGYPPVAAAFARRVIFCGTEEVRNSPESKDAIFVQISPLIRRLWKGNDRDASPVEAYYKTLSDFEPTESDEWFRGRVGQIEAIGRQSRVADAMRSLSDLRTEFPGMTQAQAEKLDYDQGLILSGHGIFTNEATQPLKRIVDSPAGQNSEFAMSSELLLIDDLARTGHLDETADRIRRFVSRYPNAIPNKDLWIKNLSLELSRSASDPAR